MKHQIKVSSARGRTASARSWRRQAKQGLQASANGKTIAHRKLMRKAPKPSNAKVKDAFKPPSVGQQSIIEKKRSEAVSETRNAEWFEKLKALREKVPHYDPEPDLEGCDEESWYRADGRVPCVTCGRLYRDHPMGGPVGFNGEKFLNRLCNGDLVKL